MSTSKKVSAVQYLWVKANRLDFSLAFCLRSIQDSKKGDDPTSFGFTYIIPARDTVAGVACFKSAISKIKRMGLVTGIRSLDTRVNTLLSSITVLRDSIHSGSISPSKMIHLFFMFSLYLDKLRDMFLIILDKIPSFQSVLVNQPYNSLFLTALGLMTSWKTLLSIAAMAACKVFQTSDLPDPAGPMINTEWRIPNNSSNSTHLRMNPGVSCKPQEGQTSMSLASRAKSYLRLTSLNSGKRSHTKRVKMGKSSATNFGVLKSRRARIKIASSTDGGLPAACISLISPRFMPPATRSTALVARRPQS